MNPDNSTLVTELQEDKRRGKPKAMVFGIAAALVVMIVLAIFLFAFAGRKSHKRSTANQADIQAQQQAMQDEAKRKQKVQLTDAPLGTQGSTEGMVTELSPEKLAQRKAEAGTQRQEGNLLIEQMLHEAQAKQEAQATASSVSQPSVLATSDSPKPAIRETNSRSLYRGVHFESGKDAAEHREKDYEKDRQSMFAYTRTGTSGTTSAGTSAPAEKSRTDASSRMEPVTPDLVEEMPRPEPARSAELARKPVQVSEISYSGLPPVMMNEGEFLDAVLVNRLVADTEPCPVICQLYRDLFDRTGRFVVFPAGTRLIGISQAIAYMGTSRLFVKFDRMILPNGTIAYFPDAKRSMLALDRTGANGIVSKVDRHWMLQFGTALMVGVLDGLGAAAQNRANQNSGTSYVIDRTNRNFEQILNTIMMRYSNIVPTITVAAGSRMKVYLSDDVLISPFARLSERSYARR